MATKNYSFLLPFISAVLVCLKNGQIYTVFIPLWFVSLVCIMLKSIKIGSLTLQHNVVLAPLAGITNLSFRTICREAGASFAFTEMVSVNGLVREGEKTLALLKSSPSDRPLGIQLFGDKPEDLAEAARIVEEYGDLIDINMGCPVRKVVGTGAGSALLQNPRKIAAIIRAVRAASSLPLTIKIRSGWHCGDNLFKEIGHIAELEGCDAITLHPRSRSLMFTGKADWSQIAELKSSLSIPVIGSGDLFTPEDCLRMLQETSCDGVMIARGALGNPWIFRQINELQRLGEYTAVGIKERADTIDKHLEFFVLNLGEKVAVSEIKKHIGWYAKGFQGASEIRRLANAAVSTNDIKLLTTKMRNIPNIDNDF